MKQELYGPYMRIIRRRFLFLIGTHSGKCTVEFVVDGRRHSLSLTLLSQCLLNEVLMDFICLEASARNSSTQPAKTCDFCRQLTANNTHLLAPKPRRFLPPHLQKTSPIETLQAGEQTHACWFRKKKKSKEEFTVYHYRMGIVHTDPSLDPNPIHKEKKGKSKYSLALPGFNILPEIANC